MYFVSLIASERKKGNSDFLARLALKTALENRATGELLYLKDFKIQECQGCMNCVFNNVQCKIDDDLYKFLTKINSCDILFLVAPTYVLSIPGKLKVVLDRFLSIYNDIKEQKTRPAISVGIAALPDWYQFQLPLMNLFLLAMGFRVVNSYIAYGAGQGEVLLSEGSCGDDTLPKILDSIREVCKNPLPKPFESQVSTYCPVDYSTIFERISGKNYRCPVCLTPCEEREDGFYFRGEDLNNHRWTPPKLKDHFDNWILKTKPRFKERLKDIYKKKKELGLE
ncbi:MAG: flavodoxin family protein [bacterium]|nr:flavodoxin family protein [bacterium]